MRFGNAVECVLHRGDRGAFEIEIDGTKVFSKHELERFPARGEIGDEVARRLGK